MNEQIIAAISQFPRNIRIEIEKLKFPILDQSPSAIETASIAFGISVGDMKKLLDHNANF